MKKIITILMCITVIFVITGCKKRDNQLNIGKKSDIKITKGDVTLSIKEGTLTKKGATLILTNNSDKNFSYGEPYEIEVKKDDVWHKINVELSFILPSYSLTANESVEIELDWEEGYGVLPSGTYRIIKDIDYEQTNGNFQIFTIASEFTIE